MNRKIRRIEAPVKPRNAASLVLVRHGTTSARVLMGVRGSGARFMPERRVFPGGVVDPADLAVSRLAGRVRENCHRRLRHRTQDSHLAPAFALTAIRETWEETGLKIGDPLAVELPQELPGGSWSDFLAQGLVPSPNRLRFIFRAITPRRYPMRFDARFFLADAEAVSGDADDLSGASGELLDLAWLPLNEAAELSDLPLITRRVLEEVAKRKGLHGIDRPVPFYPDGERSAPEELY